MRRFTLRIKNAIASSNFNIGASLSQAICSISTLYVSFCGPFFLDSTAFKKWMLYTTAFFMIQSYQRNIYLENHLLRKDEDSFHYWLACRFLPLSYLILPLIIGVVSNFRISIFDIGMTSGYLIALVQDRYRYLFLSVKPRLVIQSDGSTMFTTLFISMLGVIIFRDNLEEIFLLQLLLSPMIGLILLCRNSLAIPEKKSNKQHTIKTSRGYLNFLRTQYIAGSSISLMALMVLVDSLGVEQLKSLKMIQNFISPYQGLSVILLVAIYANKNSQENRDRYKTSLRLSKKLFLSQALAVPVFALGCLLISSRFFESNWFILDMKSLSVGLAGTVLMVCSMPISAYLRTNNLGKEILIGGLLGSLAYVVLLFGLNFSKSIFGFFLSTSISIFVTVTLNFYFAWKCERKSG